MNRSFAFVRISAVIAALSVALATASCTPNDGAPATRADSAAASTAAINIVKDRAEDLTGDGVAEKISLTARGSEIDSLPVRLEIRSADDSVLYAASWNSHFYFQYLDRPAMSDAAADSTVRRRLDEVLLDTAFRIVPADAGKPMRTPADTIQSDMMRDAIRYDIATNQWRTQHGLGLGAEVPPAAHDSINMMAAAVPRAQIDALFEELRGKKTFTFFAGGEVTYSIAWSAREQRFVTVFSCC